MYHLSIQGIFLREIDVPCVLFAALQNRLIVHLRQRVQSGELTERALARMTGISQPHLHNVLKGVRSLSWEYADQILVQLQLSLSDFLIADDPMEIVQRPGTTETTEIPRFRGHAGPSFFLADRAVPGDVYSMARSLTETLIDPILVTLRHDPLLFPYFQDGDLVLVTRQPITTGNLDPAAIYLVKTDEGTLVRSLRIGGTRLYLVSPSTRQEPRNWGEMALKGRLVGDVVVGKLVWLSRHLEEIASL